MSFKERMKFYYKNFFDHYFNLSGRARRSEFWLIALFNCIIAMLGTICLIVPGVIWCLAIIIPAISLDVRRLHDRGLSGWWALIIGILSVFLSLSVQVASVASQDGSGAASVIMLILSLLSIMFGIVKLVIYCGSSQKGENLYGFNPIEMENILNHFKAIETIYIASSPMGQMGNGHLFAFIAELELSKHSFQQIYTAKERLNRMMLLNGTIERIERLRHEMALQQENPRILSEQLEQLENELRALPNPLLG